MAQPSEPKLNKVPEIRTGDTVVVLHGKDAGKRGRVAKNPTTSLRLSAPYFDLPFES